MQGKDSEKPTGLLKGKPTGLCIPLYRICALSYELCTSQCNTNAVLCEKKISNNSSIFHDFILLFFLPVSFLPRQLTEPSKRNRTSFHCNLYQSWEMSFPKSMCEGRGRAIGVQEETEAREEGSDGVGGSYLVPSETRAGRISYWGLFVEETLRLWDSGIVRESPSADLSRRGHGEKFERKERWGDTRRKAESRTQGGITFWGRKRKTLGHKCKTLLWFSTKMGTGTYRNFVHIPGIYKLCKWCRMCFELLKLLN